VRHEEILFLARDYRAGRLDAREKAAIDRHLKDCPDCRALYSKWRLAEPSSGFTENVMSGLPRALVLEPQEQPQESPLYRFQWWGVAAAVLLVGLVFWRPEKDWVAADRSFAWMGSSSAQVSSPAGQDVVKGEKHE